MAGLTEKEIHELALKHGVADDSLSKLGNLMSDYGSCGDDVVAMVREVEERYLSVLRELVPLVKDYEDCGPVGYGWRSGALESALRDANDFLGGMNETHQASPMRRNYLVVDSWRQTNKSTKLAGCVKA